MERIITSEGLNYSQSLEDNKLVLKEYFHYETKKAHDRGISLTFSHPEFKFRNIILKNKNILLIGKRNDKTSKL